MTGDGGVRRAELVGGPLDGRVHVFGAAGDDGGPRVVRADSDVLDVVLPDGARHRYNRVGCLVPDADGTAPYDWSGRLL